MLGLKRRRRVEGWAVDVAETNADVGRSTLRQRLAENNRLWIVCTIVVVIGSLYLAFTGGSTEDATGSSIIGRAQDNYDDAEHREFEASIPTKRHFKGSVVEAHFVDRETFRVTLKNGTTTDEVAYVARIVGTQIARKFNYRPVVLAYVVGPDGTRILVASSQYEIRSSGYVTTFPKKSRSVN